MEVGNRGAEWFERKAKAIASEMKVQKGTENGKPVSNATGERKWNRKTNYSDHFTALDLLF